MKRIGYFAAAGCLGITVHLTAPGPASAADAGPIKIGYSTTLTGVQASYGHTSINAIQLAIEEVNAKGGVLGRQLELITRDNQGKPELGASQMRDLVIREKADFLFVGNPSGVAMAEAPLLAQFKKVAIVPLAASPRLTTDLFSPFMFSLPPGSQMEARALAEAVIAKFHFTRAGFIGSDYKSGHEAYKFIRERVAEKNDHVEWVVEAWPKVGESDFTPYISQLIAAKPEVVFTSVFGTDLIALIKQGVPFGLFEKTKFAGIIHLDEMQALGDQLPDGIIVATPAPFFIGSDRMPDFIKKYQAKFKDYPNESAIQSYEALEILAQAISEAGATDTERVREALEKIKYQGLRTNEAISFRPLDHQANAPEGVGLTCKNPSYPFKSLCDAVLVPGSHTWFSEEEVRALRAKHG